MIKDYHFSYQVFSSSEELSAIDKQLVEAARLNTANAYVPYSAFQVSAVALMEDGSLLSATNQENASYPVGICAERVLLSTASSVKPNMLIKTIAISYNNLNGDSKQPISPCGMCRQALLEQENRLQQPIKIILSGMCGEVVVINDAKQLLPLHFSASDMQ